VNNASVDVLANIDGPADAANTVSASLMKRPTWEQAEGNPLPLGVKWIRRGAGIQLRGSFRTCGERPLLRYAASDLVNPVLTVRFDFLHNNPALEVAPVRVNLIAARFVDTPLSAELLDDQLEKRRNQLRPALSIERVVGPADVAALAVHLMTNPALTGATYDIDGGQQFVAA
jgi:hypothetical protein